MLRGDSWSESVCGEMNVFLKQLTSTNIFNIFVLGEAPRGFGTDLQVASIFGVLVAGALIIFGVRLYMKRVRKKVLSWRQHFQTLFVLEVRSDDI